MNTEKIPYDAGVCPLCGESNKCAMLADPNATECWCESVVFPQELLDQVPPQLDRKACICKKCVDSFNENS